MNAVEKTYLMVFDCHIFFTAMDMFITENF